MFTLELMLQNLILKEYTLTDGAVLMIGRRSVNDIVLRDDLTVSRHHATIQGKGQKLLLIDRGSTNGTIVNGKKVQSARLDDGDVVNIGKQYIIKVNVPAPDKKESTPTPQAAATSTPEDQPKSEKVGAADQPSSDADPEDRKKFVKKY